MHAYVSTFAFTLVHTHTHACTCTRAWLYTHTHTYIHTWVHTHTHTLSHTHTHTPPCACAHTCVVQTNSHLCIDRQTCIDHADQTILRRHLPIHLTENIHQAFHHMFAFPQKLVLLANDPSTLAYFTIYIGVPEMAGWSLLIMVIMDHPSPTGCS